MGADETIKRTKRWLAKDYRLGAKIKIFSGHEKTIEDEVNDWLAKDKIDPSKVEFHVTPRPEGGIRILAKYVTPFKRSTGETSKRYKAKQQ